MSALQGFRIVELAERPAGEYCGKLLGDFGAEIIKVERPGSGSPTRTMAPLVGDNAPENSGLFAYLNTNKKSVALDIATKAGRATLHKLIQGADVVIDDHDEDWLTAHGLTPAEVERAHPNVVFCSITPFGHGAPKEWRHAKSLNVLHASIWGYHTPTAADPAKPPLKGPGRFLVDYDSALDAALCIVSSLYWRKTSKQGQVIDVSALEVMVSRCDTILGRVLAGEVEPSDSRSGIDQGGPHGFFKCGDGYVYLYMTSRKHWQGLCKLMGDPAWALALNPDWLEFDATPDKVAVLRQHFGEWTKDKPKDEISETAQKLGTPIVPVNDASDVKRSPQFEYRQFFQRVTHPVIGDAVHPTVPYKFSASPAKITSPAPRLGAHTAAILDAREQTNA